MAKTMMYSRKLEGYRTFLQKITGMEQMDVVQLGNTKTTTYWFKDGSDYTMIDRSGVYEVRTSGVAAKVYRAGIWLQIILFGV